MILNRVSFALICLFTCFAPSGLAEEPRGGGEVRARQVERLDRGLIVVRRSATEAYIGWRLFADDPEEIAFHLYRQTANQSPVRVNANAIRQTTDFVDTKVDLSVDNTYFVRPTLKGVEGPPSRTYRLAANSPVSQRLEVPLRIPEPGPDYRYTANDASVGDLDGDGQYEIILKWDPTNAKDNAHAGRTGNVLLDAYRLDGQWLWRIDLGRNIRAGAHYTQFLVYDFDGDGRAEVVCKTAPGTIDGRGHPVLMGDDRPIDDYRRPDGYILDGPEYLTVFDGSTGSAVASIPFDPARGKFSQWGDDYGNRVDRFTAGVAYLDGSRPSVVFGRGYYHPQHRGGQARNEVVAYDFRDSQLSRRWYFKAGENILDNVNAEYVGQGAHNMAIGDVDGDGRDEVVYGAAVIDQDGTGLYSTGWGHGDALHLSDMVPDRPGQEIFMVHENQAEHGGAGATLRHAATGELIFGIPGSGDIGRGVAADIDADSPGYEMWATADERRIFSAEGEPLHRMPRRMPTNFLVWWDGEWTRELLNGTTISDFRDGELRNFDLDPSTPGLQMAAPDAVANNGSKSTPALSADLFGDWREEIIWRRRDNSALLIYTTIIPAEQRLFTLMHDTQYRVAIAGQNSAYNQPPHPSFFVGDGMRKPASPKIHYAD